jgi:hypothetical protein
MTLIRFLNFYFFLCLGILGLSYVVRAGQILKQNHRLNPERGTTALQAPVRKSWLQSGRELLVNPWFFFHSRANRVWSHGYVAYHFGIVSIIVGYALSAGLLAWKGQHHVPIPDLAWGAPSAQSTSPANLLALVFGNAEPIPLHFLFGRFATLFRDFSWLELAAAVYGNGCLLFSLLKWRQGSLNGDVDPATRGIRWPGIGSKQHGLVRGIIFTIILTEILGRMHITENIRYWHAGLGLTLLVLIPFTYLNHILIAPIALWNAARRRHNLTIA